MRRFTSSTFLASAVALMAMGIAGCGGNAGRDVHQFAPVPRGEAASQNLEPVQPGSTLLHEAEAEFDLAKAAREKGDQKGAQQHYTRMVNLLQSANVDPAVFSDLKQDFEHQDSAAKLAQILAQHNVGKFAKGQLRIGYGGDIVVPDPLPEQVKREIDRIVNGYPRSFQYGLNESGKYLPFIRAKFKAAGLPEDLCWLAMVESQFTPNIVSHAGAGGMWQFVPETGRRYGLNADKYVDERFDWHKSTDAAIGYLTDLKTMFNGDWALALSAYNMGENGVQRIVGSCGENDWWKLLDSSTSAGLIPDETKQYYAKFVATLIAGSDPASFGFAASEKTPDDSVGVPVSGMYALTQLDKALGYSPGTLQRLNPVLVRQTTPPGRLVTLNVPREAESRFVVALAQVKEIKPVEFASYKVHKGDTTASVARKYHITVAALLKANKLKSGTRLKVGQVLKAPVKGDANLDEDAIEVASNDEPEAPAKSSARNKSSAGPKTYSVKKGDTLFDIAEATGTPIEDLRKLNKLSAKTPIFTGQELKLGNAPARAQKREDTEIHVAAAGDYPAKIARSHGMGLDEFLALNGLGKDDTIAVGQELKVRVAKAEAPAKESKSAKTKKETATKEKTAAEPETKLASAKGSPKKSASVKTASTKKKSSGKRLVHKVVSGETPSGIAKHYGVSLDDFLAWNGLSQSSVLHPGEEQVLYLTASTTTTATATVSASSEEESSDDTATTVAPRARNHASAQARATHVVGKGQNPSGIARLYGVKVADLYRWNSWSKDHVLQVGDSVAYYK